AVERAGLQLFLVERARPGRIEVLRQEVRYGPLAVSVRPEVPQPGGGLQLQLRLGLPFRFWPALGVDTLCQLADILPILDLELLKRDAGQARLSPRPVGVFPPRRLSRLMAAEPNSSKQSLAGLAFRQDGR